MYTVVNSTLDEAADLRSSVRAAMDSTDDKSLKDNLRRWQLMYESGELSEERLRVCLRRTNALAQDLRELESIQADAVREEAEARNKGSYLVAKLFRMCLRFSSHKEYPRRVQRRV